MDQINLNLWLFKHLEKTEASHKLFLRDILTHYKGQATAKTLSKSISTLFPHCSRIRVTNNGRLLTAFEGLKFKTDQPQPAPLLSHKEMARALQDKRKCSLEDGKIKVVVNSQGTYGNASENITLVIFDKKGKISVSVRDTLLELDGIECNIKMTLANVQAVINTAEEMHCCKGYKKKEEGESFSDKDKENVLTETSYSKSCSILVGFHNKAGVCKHCADLSYDRCKLNTDAEPEKRDTEKLMNIFDTLGLPTDLCNLLYEQSVNQTKVDARQRRWSGETIRACLSWWSSSPKTYEQWKHNGTLIMPSPGTLRTYKNCLQQEPGIRDSILEWMRKEADKMGLNDDDRCGGVVFDEMSIQEDLSLVHRSDCKTFYRELVDMTPAADALYRKRAATSDITLASHVLQFVFVGYGGFRFPIAHFATKEAQAPELYTILWDVIDKLRDWGFKVEYCCQDGAAANRNLLKLHFSSAFPRAQEFTCSNILSPSKKLTFIMDPKHNHKKLRNNILASGHGGHSKKLLTLLHIKSVPMYVQWEHWICAWKWDRRSNSLPIHQHLTREHLYPNQQQKMRNSLAEQCLDKNMLHLMREYQRALGDNGSHLDGTISLLEQTSIIISVFGDLKPINGLDDIRLKQLTSVAAWFAKWEETIMESNLDVHIRKKALLTRETMDDLQSALLGFVALCHHHFRNSHVSVVPGRINSDICENVFCQQRAMCNGANDNPDHRQYTYGLNTINLSQAPISRKRNSFGTCDPFNMPQSSPQPSKQLRI